MMNHEQNSQLDISGLLIMMKQRGASDLFISADVPPSVKVDGKLSHLLNVTLTEEDSRNLAYSLMNEQQRRDFEETSECNFAVYPKEIGRFRVNVFVQQGKVGMVLRTIEMEIPSIEGLHLPDVLKDIVMTKRGLVIFVGATGSGKSTSIASMLGYANDNRYGHILTIEDPVEFVHESKNCLVTQREVGVDTESFATGLKNAMRQAPDIILIGEIRAQETMDHAVVFAETGHLCMATLHANNSNQALDRIINFFPEERRDQLLMDLSLNLRAIVSQRLIANKDGKGRVPAVEVMLNTPLVSELILKGEIHELKEIMGKSRELGMQTFDQSIFDLYEAGKITYDDAILNADSPNDLRLQIKLRGKGASKHDFGGELKHLRV